MTQPSDTTSALHPLSAALENEFFHKGEVSLQLHANTFEDAAGMGPNMIKPTIRQGVDRFMSILRHIFITSVDSNQDVWVSALWGDSGFVRQVGPSSLRIASAPARSDPLFETASRAGRVISSILIDFATRSRYRINGVVSKPLGGTSADNQVFEIGSREAFGNCPKFIQRRVVQHSRWPDDRPAPVATVSAVLNDAHRQIIAKSDMFFLGSFAEGRGADCSHRGGGAGFVRVLDDRSLYWPDYPGNGMFQSLGNVAVNPRVGLIFFDFETGSTLQVTGSAVVDFNADSLPNDGGERLVRLTVTKVILTHNAIPFQYQFIDASPYNPEVDATPVCLLGECIAGANASSATLVSDNAAYPMVATLQSRRELSPDVTEYNFRTERPISFIPGQYATFNIEAQSKKHVRTWTIVGSPTADRHALSIAVKRTAQGVISNYFHQHLTPGTAIQLTGIDGSFTCSEQEQETKAQLHGEPADIEVETEEDEGLSEEETEERKGDSDAPMRSADVPRRLLFVTGGIGITPAIAMIRGLLASRPATQSGPLVDVTLLHSAKDVKDVPFLEELVAMSAQPRDGFRFRLLLSLSRINNEETAVARSRIPSALISAGRISEETAAQALRSGTGGSLEKDVEAFVCGPLPFQSLVIGHLERLGVESDRIKTEAFDF